MSDMLTIREGKTVSERCWNGCMQEADGRYYVRIKSNMVFGPLAVVAPHYTLVLCSVCGGTGRREISSTETEQE
jgi:hypothetical protein